MRNLIAFTEYIVVFLMILECGTVYSSLFPQQIGAMSVFSIIILFALSMVRYKQHYIDSKKIFLFLIFYFLYTLIFFLFSVNGYFVIYIRYICNFFIIIPALSIYFANINSNSKNRFSLLYKLSEIMICLSIISTIMWLTVSCMGKIQPTGYIPFKWGESTRNFDMFVPHYFFIYFETQYIDILKHIGLIYRNTGIFNEGPMHNMCLCVSLMIELFLKKTIKKWRIFIITVTILTVFSTTGYIFLLSVFICFSFSKKIAQKSILLSFLVICVFIFIKFVLPQKEETFSYQIRNDAAIIGKDVWLSAPILGNGYLSSIDNRTAVTSNGIWRILVDGGIYFLLLYVMALLLIPYYYYRKKYINRNLLFMFLLTFFLLYPTVVQYRYIVLMLISLAFSFTIHKKSNF